MRQRSGNSAGRAWQLPSEPCPASADASRANDCLRIMATKARAPSAAPHVSPACSSATILRSPSRTRDAACQHPNDAIKDVAPLDTGGSDGEFGARCGCSSMVEQQPSKLNTRVRFPVPAPPPSREFSFPIDRAGRGGLGRSRSTPLPDGYRVSDESSARPPRCPPRLRAERLNRVVWTACRIGCGLPRR